MSADLRFLVVDGLPGVQTFARQLLTGFGFAAERIRCASDPEAALALGLNFKPDFLISDWFAKSSLNGIALYQRLREANPACRLALLSFEISPAHEAEALAAGSRFLLSKPFTAEVLKDTLQRALAALAKEQPELHKRLSQTMNAAQPAGHLPPQIVMPLIPSLKVGDKVRFANKVETVQCVVVRQGQLVVQLHGHSAMIASDKLQRV